MRILSNKMVKSNIEKRKREMIISEKAKKYLIEMLYRKKHPTIAST